MPCAGLLERVRAAMPECPVTLRRAVFVYEGARMQAMADAPVVPEPWDDREADFRKQFLGVIERQCGPERSADPEALHDDWVRAYEAMGWRYGEVRDREAKTHPDMVPFGDLEQREQDKDAVFVALCEIARRWIGGACPHDQPRPGGPMSAPREWTLRMRTYLGRHRQGRASYRCRGCRESALLRAEREMAAVDDALPAWQPSPDSPNSAVGRVQTIRNLRADLEEAVKLLREWGHAFPYSELTRDTTPSSLLVTVGREPKVSNEEAGGRVPVSRCGRKPRGLPVEMQQGQHRRL